MPSPCSLPLCPSTGVCWSSSQSHGSPCLTSEEGNVFSTKQPDSHPKRPELEGRLGWFPWELRRVCTTVILRAFWTIWSPASPLSEISAKPNEKSRGIKDDSQIFGLSYCRIVSLMSRVYLVGTIGRILEYIKVEIPIWYLNRDVDQHIHVACRDVQDRDMPWQSLAFEVIIVFKVMRLCDVTKAMSIDKYVNKSPGMLWCAQVGDMRRNWVRRFKRSSQ